MSLPSLFEYLPYEHAVAITKLAEKEPSVTGTVVKGLVGFGGGTAAGFGLGVLAKKIYEKTQGQPLPPKLLASAGALVGGGFGLAYALYKSKEQEEIRRAIEAKRNRTQGGVSGK